MSKPTWLVAHMLKAAGVPCAEQVAMMLAKCKKNTDEPAAAALYLYGVPSDSGNVAVRSGDTVTYYDGLVAADINAFYTDELKAQYPNAGIFRASESTYYFRMLADGGYYDYDGAGNRKFCNDDTMSCMCYLPKGNSWGELSEDKNGGFLTLVKTIWSNFNLMNSNGSVFLAATDPIPVGEIVEYINDIPIYEVK